jgi:hypothetical protein
MPSVAQEVEEILDGTSRRFAVFALIASTIEAILAKSPRAKRIVTRTYLFVYDWLARLVNPLLRPTPSPRMRRRWLLIFLTGWIIGLILSLGANGFGAYISGTVGPDDPESRFLAFSGDTKNLNIYRYWAPLYVAFSLTIVIWTGIYWKHFRFFADHLSQREGPHLTVLRLPASLYLTTAISFLATCFNLWSDLHIRYGVAPLPRLLWYLREIAPGEYGLNAAGYFHYISNAIKLWLVIFALISYIAISIELVRCVHAAARRPSLDEREKRIYGWCIWLGDYFFLFIIWFFIVIVFHNSTWSDTPSGKLGFNLIIVQIAIIVGFIFVIEIPRSYVKYRYLNGSPKFQAIHREIKQVKRVRSVNRTIIASKILMYFVFIELFLDHTLQLHLNEKLLTITKGIIALIGNIT